MALVIFDLDNTLLSGDSDYEWGRFLVEKELVDAELYASKNDFFYQEYVAGKLDIYEFAAFSLEPLTRYSMEELASFHQEYMEKYIVPIMSEKSKALIAHHKKQGDVIIIITATNSFVTTPIGHAFGVETILGIDPKIKNGRYTTEIDGTPTFQEGKIKRLNEWLQGKEISMDGSYFYSDSMNDLPLLEVVDNPIAVDPDERLNTIAEQRGWKIISLRDDT